MLLPSMKGLFVLALSAAFAASSHAVITLSSSSSLWTAVSGDLDYHTDQQTGQGSDDIVGGDVVNDTYNTAFLTRFQDNATGDDFIAFRGRMNSPEQDTSTFDGYYWVAVEANGDDVVDAYIRATTTNGSSGLPEISIHSPGTFDPSRNISPNTTDITAKANDAYVWNVAGYMDYRAVDPSIDGPGIVSNIDPLDSNPDWYVSFQLPFQSLQAFLADSANNGGQTINVDLNTPLRYLSATSTQGNTFNQDIGGLDGGTNSTVLWSVDGFTDPLTPTGNPIPEPGPSMLVGLSGLLLLLIRRRV